MVSYDTQENRDLLANNGINPILIQLYDDIVSTVELSKKSIRIDEIKKVELKLKNLEQKYEKIKEFSDFFGPAFYQSLIVKG
jgi:hypothetical protein